MVDNIEAQSVYFTGQTNQQKKVVQKDVMDMDTQNALVESTKNFNKLANDMMFVCGNICIKNFGARNLNREETNCVENCQKKFYHSYALGKKIVDNIVKQVNNTDIFSNKKEIDIIQDSVDSMKINNLKIV
jgi:hypothetical protein